jgi:aminoglycoside/choline kinase family phosphotransferase
MEAIPDHTGYFTPGHKLGDFIRIDHALRAAGLCAPEILAADETEGYLLLEDMGDMTAARAIDEGAADASGLYRQATDVLVRLRETIGENSLHLPLYRESHVHKGRQRIVDWYLPAIRGGQNDDGLLESYLAAWAEIERALPPCAEGFVHGDYHMQNLMQLKDGALGVLDFQGAMWGPRPYDLANLLEDIRRDVPEDVRHDLLAYYCGNDAVMKAWYRVLATQFHCRILGQIFRMALVANKASFMKFIPRVQAYIKAALKDPLLAPLARWMREEKVDLDAGNFDLETVRKNIRPDAF